MTVLELVNYYDFSEAILSGILISLGTGTIYIYVKLSMENIVMTCLDIVVKL